MQPIEVSFVLEPSITPCSFQIDFLVDGTVLWQTDNLQAAETVKVLIPDSTDVQPRYLDFIMQGKQPEHTELDGQGNIVLDHVVTVRDFRIEGIVLQTVLESQAVYDHDFNGSSEPIRDEFFGIMGCNGRVRFEITTPIFLWLLDNV